MVVCPPSLKPLTFRVVHSSTAWTRKFLATRGEVDVLSLNMKCPAFWITSGPDIAEVMHVHPEHP